MSKREDAVLQALARSPLGALLENPAPGPQGQVSPPSRDPFMEKMVATFYAADPPTHPRPPAAEAQPPTVCDLPEVLPDAEPEPEPVDRRVASDGWAESWYGVQAEFQSNGLSDEQVEQLCKWRDRLVVAKASCEKLGGSARGDPFVDRAMQNASRAAHKFGMLMESCVEFGGSDGVMKQAKKAAKECDACLQKAMLRCHELGTDPQEGGFQNFISRHGHHTQYSDASAPAQHKFSAFERSHAMGVHRTSERRQVATSLSTPTSSRSTRGRDRKLEADLTTALFGEECQTADGILDLGPSVQSEFERIDLNGDGVIDRDEYSRYRSSTQSASEKDDTLELSVKTDKVHSSELDSSNNAKEVSGGDSDNSAYVNALVNRYSGRESELKRKQHECMDRMEEALEHMDDRRGHQPPGRRKPAVPRIPLSEPTQEPAAAPKKSPKVIVGMTKAAAWAAEQEQAWALRESNAKRKAEDAYLKRTGVRSPTDGPVLRAMTNSPLGALLEKESDQQQLSMAQAPIPIVPFKERQQMHQPWIEGVAHKWAEMGELAPRLSSHHSPVAAPSSPAPTVVAPEINPVQPAPKNVSTPGTQSSTWENFMSRLFVGYVVLAMAVGIFRLV